MSVGTSCLLDELDTDWLRNFLKRHFQNDIMSTWMHNSKSFFVLFKLGFFDSHKWQFSATPAIALSGKAKVYVPLPS